MTLEPSELFIIFIGALVAVVGYLLKRKDEEQERNITDLYEKHHTDAERLHTVELRLATDHYVKSELDSKFDKMEEVMTHGFESLGVKFDVLSATLMAHITKEEVHKKP